MGLFELCSCGEVPVCWRNRSFVQRSGGPCANTVGKWAADQKPSWPQESCRRCQDGIGLGVCVSVSTVSKPPAAQPVPDMSLSAAAPIRDRTRQYQTQCESTPSKNGPMRMSLWQIPPQIAPVRGIPRRPKSNHAVVIDCTKRIRVPISEPTVSSVAGNAESAELFRPLIYSHCPDLPGATTQTSTMAILNPTIEQVKASVDAALEAANASLRALNKNVFMSNPYSYKSSY